MTDQDQKMMLKLQEYQVLNIWLGQLINHLRIIEQQLARKNGDIHLLSGKQNLQHDIKEVSKTATKLTLEIADYFNVKYGLKIKSLEKA